jgi:hypothetical protein
MDQPKKKSVKLTDPERHKRFVETAIKVEASGEPEAFDRAFSSLELRATSESDGASSRLPSKKGHS